MADLMPHSETPTARGFADMVVVRKSGIFIFEFKFERTAAAALQQIHDRGYAARYTTMGRPLFLIGLAYNETKLSQVVEQVV